LALHGIDGRRTTAARDRHLDKAKWSLIKAEKKEKDLRRAPTIENVQIIMDLYREAAEVYGAVDDQNHQKVIQQLHKFLSLPLVTAILEGKPVKAEEQSPGYPDKKTKGGKKMEPGDVIESSWDTDSDDGLAQEEARHKDEGLKSLQKTMMSSEQFLAEDGDDSDEDIAIDLGQGTNALEDLELNRPSMEIVDDTDGIHQDSSHAGDSEDGDVMGLQTGMREDLSKSGPNFFVSAFDDNSVGSLNTPQRGADMPGLDLDESLKKEPLDNASPDEATNDVPQKDKLQETTAEDLAPGVDSVSPNQEEEAPVGDPTPLDDASKEEESQQIVANPLHENQESEVNSQNNTNPVTKEKNNDSQTSEETKAQEPDIVHPPPPPEDQPQKSGPEKGNEEHDTSDNSQIEIADQNDKEPEKDALIDNTKPAKLDDSKTLEQGGNQEDISSTDQEAS